jgi:hypothetical protein
VTGSAARRLTGVAAAGFVERNRARQYPHWRLALVGLWQVGGLEEEAQPSPEPRQYPESPLRLFDEWPSDLVSLCARCHADLHHKTPAKDNQLTMFPLREKKRKNLKA